MLDQRGFSQAVFVLIGMMIIVAGLWSLYMGDAPYHPEVSGSERGDFLTSD